MIVLSNLFDFRYAYSAQDSKCLPAREFITDEEKQWVRKSDGQIKGTTEVFCSVDFRRSNPECPSLGESILDPGRFPEYCNDLCVFESSGGNDPEFATSAVSIFK